MEFVVELALELEQLGGEVWWSCCFGLVLRAEVALGGGLAEPVTNWFNTTKRPNRHTKHTKQAKQTRYISFTASRALPRFLLTFSSASHFSHS